MSLLRRRSSLAVAVAGAVVVAGILIAVSLAFSGGDDRPQQAAPTAVVDDIPQSGTVLGDPQAPVTLIQYEDIQCPFCRTYTEGAFADLVEEYVRSGKIKVDFRGLEFLGPDSTKALSLVLAAAKQNRAWQLVELLYRNQGPENSGWVTDELLRALAADAGLDVDLASTDAGSPEISRQIAALANEAAARRVRGTPSFFVRIGDGAPYAVNVSELTIDAFRPVLDDALD